MYSHVGISPKKPNSASIPLGKRQMWAGERTLKSSLDLPKSIAKPNAQPTVEFWWQKRNDRKGEQSVTKEWEQLQPTSPPLPFPFAWWPGAWEDEDFCGCVEQKNTDQLTLGQVAQAHAKWIWYYIIVYADLSKIRGGLHLFLCLSSMVFFYLEWKSSMVLSLSPKSSVSWHSLFYGLMDRHQFWEGRAVTTILCTRTLDVLQPKQICLAPLFSSLITWKKRVWHFKYIGSIENSF